MSSTETNAADALAGALFDELVAPLGAAMRASGRAYFPRAGDGRAASYYGPPSLAAMQAADFAFPGAGTAEGLIEALAAYWTGQGEAGLAAMAPRLKTIADVLREEAAANDGEVDILCYTMF